MSTSMPWGSADATSADSPGSVRTFPFEAHRRGRFGDRPICPRCGGPNVAGWGSFSGRRRYRCLACRRTFSDFTGTPLAYLKRIDRWPEHASCILASSSVRAAARHLGVHRDTAFRWRHRLLSALRAADPGTLRGSVSFGATFFQYSEKGSRTLTRAPRRRGWRWGWEWLFAPKVWVLVARASDGRVASGVTGPQKPLQRDYSRFLVEHMDVQSRALAVGPDQVDLARGILRRSDISHRRRLRVRIDATERDRLRSYVQRLRQWVRRFRGIATRYVPNYLAWHRFLEACAGRSEAEGHLLLGTFP